MKMASSVLYCSLLLLTTMIAVSSATTTTFSVGRNCPSFEIHNVNEHQSYKIVWNSLSLPLEGCKYGFIGRGDEIFDEYKVCIESLEYRVNDCNVKLNYYFGYSLTPNKTYSCSIGPTRICAKPDTYFDVEITHAAAYSSDFSTSSSSLMLKVTAEKTLQYSSIIGAIVGGVIGGVVFIATIVIVVIVIVCNRSKRNTRGHVYNANTSGNIGMATYNQPIPTTDTTTNRAQPFTQPPPYNHDQSFVYSNDIKQPQNFSY